MLGVYSPLHLRLRGGPYGAFDSLVVKAAFFFSSVSHHFKMIVRKDFEKKKKKKTSKLKSVLQCTERISGL